jgi:hypothetical protein
MGQPLRNVLLQNEAVTLATDVQDDLPVNPLYLILYTLRGQQLAAADTADNIPSLANLLGVVSRLEVLFRGSTVVSGSLVDLAVQNAAMGMGFPFIIHQGDAAANDIAVTVPIALGRKHKMGREAFPATRRGELTLRRVFASTSPNLDTGEFTEQIETVELLGGEPEAFLKYVTLTDTPTATGDHDVDLPMGNPIASVLLFGTTGWTAQTSVASISQLKLLVENVEFAYALANWETLNGELNRMIPRVGELQMHTHTENLAAAYGQDVATAKPSATESILDNYGMLDFDMFHDDANLLDTVGRGRVHMRITAGTADLMRALPLEIIRLTAAGAGAAA